MDKINLKAYIEKIEGKMVAVATDETVDRHGESLPIDAWDLKNFKKNPVLQFAHDYNTPPVGLVKNIRRDGKRLIFEPVFHEFTALAKDVKKLYQEGIMTSFSVGFIPHINRQEDGKQETRLELLEVSAVPIPANPSAIVIEKALEKDKEFELDKEVFTAWTKKELEQKDVEETIGLSILLEHLNWMINEFTRNGVNTKVLDKMNEMLVILMEVIKMEAVLGKKEFVVDQKVGKVISKKNRKIIENAVSALSAVLEADNKEEPEKGIDLIQGTDLELEIKTELPKVKKPKANKGRSQVDLQKSLVALEGSIGFIKREVLRQRKQ